MLNEESISIVEPLCYLILLMDSLGLEVNSVKLSEFWTKSLQQKELSVELIELLVFFWKRSGKQGEFSPLTFRIPESNRIEIIKTPELEQTQNIKEKPTQKETLNLTEIQLESTPVQVTSVISQEDTGLSGRYIYGIVFDVDDFQTTGIDGNPVYLMSYRDIGVLVHACHPKAYESNDQEQVENWLRQHQNVVDEAMNYTKSVVPMSFDVIIAGSTSTNPDKVLMEWLQERYNAIKELLEQLSGRVEYGIKISCSTEMLTEKVTKENLEIIELTNRLASMSKGTAFLFRSELSQKIRKAVEEECKTLANEIIAKIRQIVINIKENKLDTGVSNNQKPILNLAVLADPDKVEVIGDLLENLQTNGRCTVVFTGPWPAYSFVKDLE